MCLPSPSHVRWSVSPLPYRKCRDRTLGGRGKERGGCQVSHSSHAHLHLYVSNHWQVLTDELFRRETKSQFVAFSDLADVNAPTMAHVRLAVCHSLKAGLEEMGTVDLSQ